VVVRADLPKGVQAAMIVHAVGDSLTAGHPPNTFAVVLAARDRAHIEEIATFLEGRGVELVRVVEPDPPWNGEVMSLGIRPGRKEELRRHLSAFPLLR
jgi:hypothetical protein